LLLVGSCDGGALLMIMSIIGPREPQFDGTELVGPEVGSELVGAAVGVAVGLLSGGGAGRKLDDGLDYD